MFIQTKVDVLARLVAVASNDPRRCYIQGVHVRTRGRLPGVIVEATNGHIAALEHDAGGECARNASIHPLAIKAIVAAAKGVAKRVKLDPDELRVRIRDDRFAIITPDGETELHPMCTFPPESVQNPFVDGDFPDIERVMPKADEDAAPVLDCYNAKLIATLAGSARTVKRDAALTYCLYSTSIGSPARMKVAGAPNWLGVIMPMRGEMDGPAAPWERAATFQRSEAGQALHDKLRHHVSGAIERGEAEAIVEQAAA